MILVLFAASGASPVIRAQANPPSEYELKAAFLFNFAKFIEWPDSSFATPQSPFAICILGTDPFGQALDDTLQGKIISDRPVALERLKDMPRARQCHMVFVSLSESRRLPEILDRLRGANVLLVGEAGDFAASGGAVQFTLEENRVRFMINTDATQRAGLKLSSKLLSLARIVHDSPARKD